MTRSELELLLDLILNKADAKDLEVVTQALKRRASDLSRVGSPNFDPRQMSKRMSLSIQKQLGATRQMALTSARGTIEKLIRQKVPDIPQEHLEALLAQWMPTDVEKASQNKTALQTFLPADVLTAMIRDFIAFGTGAMTATRQIELHDELSDWQEAYWKCFPDRVQRLIHLFFNDKISLEVFWKEVKESLAFSKE